MKLKEGNTLGTRIVDPRSYCHSSNKAYLFHRCDMLICKSVQCPDMKTGNVARIYFVLCLMFTSLPAQLPYTDSPPPRWSPAHLCGWPVWLNLTPHTWSHTGTPHGCQERWCAWCHYSPAPLWCSLGQARTSLPDPEEESRVKSNCLKNRQTEKGAVWL